MKKLLPLLIILILSAAGGAGGYFLRPPAPEATTDENAKTEPVKKDVADEDVAFVKLNNQFVIPVVRENRVRALVVLSLSLQTDTTSADALRKKEPKLRDAFIRVLFDHAYGGGFDGAFTSSPTLDALQHALIETAQKVGGPYITDVLITDITRQDA